MKWGFQKSIQVSLFFAFSSLLYLIWRHGSSTATYTHQMFFSLEAGTVKLKVL